MLPLADTVLILHFVYVLGVVLPVPLIVIGGLAQWRFVRSSWFRNVHLVMSTIVVVEAVIGVACPLTSLEQLLRQQAGQGSYPDSFMGHWVGKVLFYDWAPWVFLLAYALFDVIVIILYRVFPPRWLTRFKHQFK